MNKKLLLAVLSIMIFAHPVFAKKDSSGGSNSVRGYTKKDGTYVEKYLDVDKQRYFQRKEEV